MDLDALIAKVRQKMDQDDSFTDADITDEINNGISKVSKRVKLPINDVATDITCTAGEISASLPDDYQRGLYKCTNKTTGKDCDIYNSKGRLSRACSGLDNDGDIDSVAVVGRNLFFQGSPSEDTELTLYYYAKPDLLVDGTDEPACLPDEDDQKALIISFALGELYEDIEDGLEGPTPNTDRYKGKFELAVRELKSEIREGVSNPIAYTTGCDI